MTKKITINDIAHLANVSKKTVSRVINNETGVGASTRQRVKEIIEINNYHPDPQARGLASKRSFLFALIYDNPNSSFVSDIMSGVLERCRPHGYELVVHPCNIAAESMLADILSFIKRLKIDGVILLPPLSESEELLEVLNKNDCEYISLQSGLKNNRNERVISFNDRQAAKKVAEHFVALKHQNIGLVQGPEGHLSSTERLEGFRDALLKNNIELPEYRIAQGDYTFQSGLQGGEWLLNMEDRPSAIFACNDEMALGVMVAAEKSGLRIPDDLSIVGFDDSPYASKVWPTLTTVNLNLEYMGILATEKLLKLCNKNIENSHLSKSELLPKFVKRQSTAKSKY